MTNATLYGKPEKGASLLLVVVFIAMAVAGLAAITSGRVVSASGFQRTLEAETRAVNDAYAQLHFALNIVNGSAYDADNHNLQLLGAMAGDYGGTAAGQQENAPSWMQDPEGIVHGYVEGTSVRVYRASEYIKRLQQLKGETVAQTAIDPLGQADAYFALEAIGRHGDTVRLISALVRENEPFSSFVFFQNRGTLGVSGAPRGLIHCNDQVHFYFPDGSYVDGVSAVNGFDYKAGATTANTSIQDGNPTAQPINLEAVDFAELRTKATLFQAADGLDAMLFLHGSGDVEIQQWTPPRFDMVEMSYSWWQYMGYHYETEIQNQQVQVGEVAVTYQEQEIVGYNTVTWTEMENVQVGTAIETYQEIQTVQTGTTTETRYRDVQVLTGTTTVTKSRQDPIWDTRTVTKTRWVEVWQPYETSADGGTAVGGGGAGELGEYVWVQEEYQVEESYISGYKTVTWTEEEPVYQTVQEAYDVVVPVYEDQTVTLTREVPVYEVQPVEYSRDDPIYEMVTKTRMDPVYETQPVEVQVKVNDYELQTTTWMEEVFVDPVWQATDVVALSSQTGGTIYVDGRITRLEGDLNGRLTIVANETVKITDSIRYVDDNGEPAMLNGGDYTQPYQRNPDYTGQSVLGVIARDDILYQRYMPSSAEINGTLMAVGGRVGIDGFWSVGDGELVEDSSSARETYLSAERQEKERAYDRAGGVYKTRPFTKDSMRRIGGIVSNDRILETYIQADSSGRSQVAAGFKRGNMKFDINLLFNPPPNFVEVPRPVVTSFVPVYFVRESS